jgi:signal transduction histidine kinase
MNLVTAITAARHSTALASRANVRDKFRGASRVDAVLAILVFAGLMIELAIGQGPLVPSVALALISSAPLVVRRRYPVAVLFATTFGLLACLAVFRPTRTAIVVVILAMYTVSLQGRRRRSVLVGVAMAPITVAAISIGGHHGFEIQNAALYLALVLGALAVGDAVRGRRELRLAEAEEIEAAAQHRLDEQRLELAHELHDTLAHTLVGINVRAGAAAHSLASNPDDGLAALEEIKLTSAEALAELRSTLRMLRPSASGAPLSPAQSLADLEDLVDRVGGTGLRVGLVFNADPDTVSRSVGHAAYRIVQEALTNVLRHSNATQATVQVTQTEALLDVEVTDNGRAVSSQPASGHGLQGMMERAHALGGSCETGVAEDGGWRVHALLPLKVGTP